MNVEEYQIISFQMIGLQKTCEISMHVDSLAESELKIEL